MAIGDPTGIDLCSGTTNGDTLDQPASWTEREVNFGGGTALTSGVKYAIVVKAPDALTVASLNWNGPNSDDLATGEFLYTNNAGTSWTELSRDHWFKTKAEAVEKDTHEPSTGSWYSGGQIRWRAQTFTASSSYTITSVVVKLQRAFGHSIGTITVSIQALEAATPSKATNPTPTDAADDITLDQATVTWEDGGGATSYNVYYGEDAGSLELVSEGQAELSFTISGATSGSPFDYTISRAWRIDSINDAGTTTGDVWTFTTITFNAPAPGPRGFGGGGGDGDGAGEVGDFAGGAISDGQSNIKTRLIGFANNKVWYEDT